MPLESKARNFAVLYWMFCRGDQISLLILDSWKSNRNLSWTFALQSLTLALCFTCLTESWNLTLHQLTYYYCRVKGLFTMQHYGTPRIVPICCLPHPVNSGYLCSSGFGFQVFSLGHDMFCLVSSFSILGLEFSKMFWIFSSIKNSQEASLREIYFPMWTSPILLSTTFGKINKFCQHVNKPDVSLILFTPKINLFLLQWHTTQSFKWIHWNDIYLEYEN